MQRKINLLSIVLLIFYMATPPMYKIAFADKKNQGAEVIELSGEVNVKRGEGSKSFEAFEGMNLAQGDRIKTGKDSYVIVKWYEGTESTLGSLSELVIAELKTSDKEKKTGFKLWSGQMWNKIKKLLNVGDKYEVETGTAVMGVRGTQFLVIVNPKTGETRNTVMDGVVGTSPIMSPIEKLIYANEETTSNSEGTKLNQSQQIDVVKLIEQTDVPILYQIVKDLVEASEADDEDELNQLLESKDLKKIEEAFTLTLQAKENLELAAFILNAIQDSPKKAEIQQFFEEKNTSFDNVMQVIQNQTETLANRLTDIITVAKEAGVDEGTIVKWIENIKVNKSIEEIQAIPDFYAENDFQQVAIASTPFPDSNDNNNSISKTDAIRDNDNTQSDLNSDNDPTPGPGGKPNTNPGGTTPTTPGTDTGGTTPTTPGTDTGGTTPTTPGTDTGSTTPTTPGGGSAGSSGSTTNTIAVNPSVPVSINSSSLSSSLSIPVSFNLTQGQTYTVTDSIAASNPSDSIIQSAYIQWPSTAKLTSGAIASLDGGMRFATANIRIANTGPQVIVKLRTDLSSAYNGVYTVTLNVNDSGGNSVGTLSFIVDLQLPVKQSVWTMEYSDPTKRVGNEIPLQTNLSNRSYTVEDLSDTSIVQNAYVSGGKLLVNFQSNITAQQNTTASYSLTVKNNKGSIVETVALTVNVNALALEINTFKSNYAQVLNITNPAISDKAAVEAALTAFASLTASAKSGLSAEKIKLDQLSTQIANLESSIANPVIIYDASNLTHVLSTKTDLTNGSFSLEGQVNGYEIEGVITVSPDGIIVPLKQNLTADANGVYEHEINILQNGTVVETIYLTVKVNVPATIHSTETLTVTSYDNIDSIFRNVIGVSDVYVVSFDNTDYINASVWYDGTLEISSVYTLTDKDNGTYYYTLLLMDSLGNVVETVAVTVVVDLPPLPPAEVSINYTNPTVLSRGLEIGNPLSQVIQTATLQDVPADAIIQRVYNDGWVVVEFQNGLTTANNGIYKYTLQFTDNDTGEVVGTTLLTINVNIPSGNHSTLDLTYGALIESPETLEISGATSADIVNLRSNAVIITTNVGNGQLIIEGKPGLTSVDNGYYEYAINIRNANNEIIATAAVGISVDLPPTPEELAQQFKANNAYALNLLVPSIVDKVYIETALIEYGYLSSDVQMLLVTEKETLDSLMNQIAVLEEIENFQNNHAFVLSLNVDTVTAGDLAIIEAALSDYNNVSIQAQDGLAAEKALLDNLYTKATANNGDVLPPEGPPEPVPTNTPPVAKVITEQSITVWTPLIFNITELATDNDGDLLSFVNGASSSNAAITAQIVEGKLQITATEAGTSTISVEVTDGINAPVTVTFTVTAS